MNKLKRLGKLISYPFHATFVIVALLAILLAWPFMYVWYGDEDEKDSASK